MPKAVATDSLEQYKVEATQMSTHRTQARQARTNLQNGGRGELQGVGDELHMELWDKNQDKGK